MLPLFMILSVKEKIVIMCSHTNLFLPLYLLLPQIRKGQRIFQTLFAYELIFHLPFLSGKAL